MKNIEEGIDKDGIQCWYGLLDASLENIFYSLEEANQWLNN